MSWDFINTEVEIHRKNGRKHALGVCDVCGRLTRGKFGMRVESSRPTRDRLHQFCLCPVCADRFLPDVEKVIDNIREEMSKRELTPLQEIVEAYQNERTDETGIYSAART